jgi:hypothetical protein
VFLRISFSTELKLICLWCIMLCFTVVQMDEAEELAYGVLGSHIQETFDNCYSALMRPYLKSSQLVHEMNQVTDCDER